MRLKTVVLPAPLGPMRPQSSPSLTVKSTALTAVRPPKRMVVWESWRSGAGMAISAFGRTGCSGCGESRRALDGNGRGRGPRCDVNRREKGAGRESAKSRPGERSSATAGNSADETRPAQEPDRRVGKSWRRPKDCGRHTKCGPRSARKRRGDEREKSASAQAALTTKLVKG